MTDTILITGANGEMGHSLITVLAERGPAQIVALDLHPLDEALAARCQRAVVGDVLDRELLRELAQEFDFNTVYHLAALLSTSAERTPYLAHQVNVNGTLNMLETMMRQSQRGRRPVKFLYPSSIAVYGLPDLETNNRAGRLVEGQWMMPTTMYGVNKLYGEHVGRYYTSHYRQLDEQDAHGDIDFRSLRLPGLISALTVPTGGTSDYLPEMLHSVAQDKPYKCFVREDTRIPFMAMPDGVKALLDLMVAPREALQQQVFNVTSFNPSAGEFYELLQQSFPAAKVTFEPDTRRQRIVDSWPVDVDDSAARAQWGWQPDYDLHKTLNEYLIPTVKQHYQTLA